MVCFDELFNSTADKSTSVFGEIGFLEAVRKNALTPLCRDHMIIITPVANTPGCDQIRGEKPMRHATVRATEPTQVWKLSPEAVKLAGGSCDKVFQRVTAIAQAFGHSMDAKSDLQHTWLFADMKPQDVNDLADATSGLAERDSWGALRVYQKGENIVTMVSTTALLH